MKTEEVVIEKARERNRWLDARSMWYNSGIVNEDGLRYFELPSIEVKVSDEDDRYIVKSNEEGRLDLIAYKVYGRVDYWWILAVANDTYFPLDVKAGDVLIIPSKIYVEAKVLELV